MFTTETWTRIYDAENRLITLTDGKLTIKVVEKEPECEQGTDGKAEPARTDPNT
jgi:hypothetical protein